MPLRFAGRNRILTLGLSGILALGVVGAGSIALAEDPGTPGSPTDQAGPRDGKHRPRAIRVTIKHVIDASGLSADVFKQGFKDGKPVNQILAENNVDSAAVQQQVLSDLNARLAQAVADGKLTQEQADRVSERAPEALARLMDRVPQPRDGNGGHRPNRGAIVKNALETAAQTIGIEVQELKDGLKSGKTIAEVASENGSSGDAVIAALVAQANTAIDQAVADGKLDADKAETAKAKAAERITKLVNEGGPRAGRHGAGGAN
ncbi:MAG: hypothetical protein DYG91_06380 [Chloroflexi bacterium CFX7]|nr:hypothetical protein [Chloroflexi bacterium CFX7]MCK6564239.1 hypothetical protein [Dehalococcoidia bacterium]RIL02459.1 MAG: hypothetical protein DCC78_07255 [bacterium]